MKRFRFLGLSIYAERHLCEEDTEVLNQMIGSEVFESENKSIVDGKTMFIMPDGEETHIDYLELEEITEELPFDNSELLNQ